MYTIKKAPPYKVKKAYKIKTDVDEYPNDYLIYSAENAGKAKYKVITDLMNAGYRKPTFSWIKSCLRAPEYDTVAANEHGCIAWVNGSSNWRTLP
jgi:hypothetical protein